MHFKISWARLVITVHTIGVAGQQMLIPACHSLTGVYFLHHLNIAAGGCGHSAVLLAHSPGVHSHRQSLLETSGVCLLKTASYWGLHTDSLQHDLVCQCAYCDQQIVWWDALLLMPVSTHVSLCLCWELQQEEEESIPGWSLYICASIHMSGKSLKIQTCEALGKTTPHPNPFLPEGLQLGFGVGLWTRSTSSAQTIAGSNPEDRNLMRWFTVPTHDCH